MKLRQLLTDDDAVSPVIGVILMVAITVILAAVIGAFVLGFGGGGPSAPSVTWETSTENTSTGHAAVVFEHGGGDTVSDASVLQAGSSPSDADLEEWDGTDLAGTDLDGLELSTGDGVGINTTDTYNSVSSGNSGEYTLVWSSPDSDSTQELASQNI